MKRILLATTTLVGSVALFAGAAHAGGPQITIGGVADFQAGFVSEDNDANQRSGAFRSDTELTFDIDGIADNGLRYGGHIQLEADVEDDVDNQGSNAGRTYLYVEGNWGRLQGGSDLGVSNTMKVDASRIARATGGIDGDFRYWGIGTGVSEQIIAAPDLFLDYGANQLGNKFTENINKLSYYTPRFSGFQAGVSFLFDTASITSDRGQIVSQADNTAGEAENVLVGAVNWEGNFDTVGIKIGATGESGSAELSTYQDLQTWQVGAEVDFMGFLFAASYGDWGDSLRLKSAGNVDDTNFWTAGVAYEIGAFGASVTYLDSTYAESTTIDNEFNNLVFGVDYALAPGFTPYAEVSFFDIDGGQGAGINEDNNGSIIIIGSQLAF